MLDKIYNYEYIVYNNTDNYYLITKLEDLDTLKSVYHINTNDYNVDKVDENNTKKILDHFKYNQNIKSHENGRFFYLHILHIYKLNDNIICLKGWYIIKFETKNKYIRYVDENYVYNKGFSKFEECIIDTLKKYDITINNNHLEILKNSYETKEYEKIILDIFKEHVEIIITNKDTDVLSSEDIMYYIDWLHKENNEKFIDFMINNENYLLSDLIGKNKKEELTEKLKLLNGYYCDSPYFCKLLNIMNKYKHLEVESIKKEIIDIIQKKYNLFIIFVYENVNNISSLTYDNEDLDKSEFCLIVEKIIDYKYKPIKYIKNIPEHFGFSESSNIYIKDNDIVFENYKYNNPFLFFKIFQYYKPLFTNNNTTNNNTTNNLSKSADSLENDYVNV